MEINECVIKEKNFPIRNWPIKLSQTAIVDPAFNDGELVIAADCSAFAHGEFAKITRGKALLICCTKFSKFDYANKLAKIITTNNVRSIHAVRMKVPCCGGLVMMIHEAIKIAGKEIPLKVSVISPNGEVNV